MEKKLLLSSLLSLSLLTFSGTAKAQESADATFTGTLSGSIEVTKIQDGSATIDPTTGDLEILATPNFNVTSTLSTGVNGRFTSAPVSNSPTLNLVGDQTFIALTNGAPAETAVSNAISNDPAQTANPNVIAYEIAVEAKGQPGFTFDEGGLEGAILTEAGAAGVSVFLTPTARSQTFGPNDEAGDYTVNFTLNAFGSL